MAASPPPLAMAALPDPGTPKLRRFEVRGRLGEGSSGVVYEAIDRETSARVALKTLRDAGPERIRTLKHEFRTVQDLQHPNIVQLLELFEEDGAWYLTMEFVAGTDFLSYVRPPGGLHEFRLRSTMAQLALALTALHEAGKIHMDVKPANVLVTPKGRVVVVDFGIVRDIAPVSHALDAELRGTAAYMAPEQALGDDIGPAADWYAVGVMLFCALTGRMPIPGAGLEVMTNKLRMQAPRARSLDAQAPEDLDTLCDELLAMEPEARPVSRAVLTRLGVDLSELSLDGPKSGVEFVGRHEELRSLERAFSEARGRGGVAVVVEGASGIGKSRLVRRFLDGLVTSFVTPLVLTGRCYERESVPYKGIDAALDELALALREMPTEQVEKLLPPDAELLTLAFPVLAEALRVAPALLPPANPADARVRVFGAVRALVARLAEETPLVIAIDDLQWAGADTLALLSELLRAPNAPRILLVATSRTELAEGALPGDVRRVRLGNLAPADARALVATLLKSEEGVPADDLRAILEEGGGQPLFLEEIVRERGRHAHPNQLVRLDDAIHARVVRLDDGPRLLLEAVCVAGSPTPVEVISRATGIAVGDVFRITAALRTAQFVAASAVRLHDLLAPYHDRVRETVVARLSPEASGAWHRRLAMAFEALELAGNTGDLEAIALHFQAAGDAERASFHAARAAERLTQALAFERAVQFYELALATSALPEPLEDDASKARSNAALAARTALRGALADALANAGRGAEAAAIRLELAVAREGDRDRVAALDLRRRAAEELLVSGRIAAGAVVLEEALAAARVFSPVAPAAVLFGLLFLRLVLRVRGFAFVERDAGAIDPAHLVRIDTVFSAGAGYAMTDNVRGAYYLARNLLFALAAGERHRVTVALGFQAASSATMGSRSYARTESLVVATLKLAERGASARARALCHLAPGYRDYFVGRFRAAAEHLARAEAVLRDECTGAQLELNPTRVLLYRTLGYLGELDQLRTRVPPMLREAQRIADVNTQRNLEGGPMPLLALAADDPAGAEAHVRKAAEMLQGERFHLQHYMGVLAQTQTALYLGDAEQAVVLMDSAWPSLRRSLLLVVEIVRVLALEHRGRAHLARALRMPPGRARAAELASVSRDAARMDRVPLPWSRALATLLRAGVAGAAEPGSRLRLSALPLSLEAARLLDAQGMMLYAAAARMQAGAFAGGDEGEAQWTEGVTALVLRGVVVPPRFASVLAPLLAAQSTSPLSPAAPPRSPLASMPPPVLVLPTPVSVSLPPPPPPPPPPIAPSVDARVDDADGKSDGRNR